MATPMFIFRTSEQISLLARNLTITHIARVPPSAPLLCYAKEIKPLTHLQAWLLVHLPYRQLSRSLHKCFGGLRTRTKPLNQNRSRPSRDAEDTEEQERAHATVIVLKCGNESVLGNKAQLKAMASEYIDGFYDFGYRRQQTPIVRRAGTSNDTCAGPWASNRASLRSLLHPYTRVTVLSVAVGLAAYWEYAVPELGLFRCVSFKVPYHSWAAIPAL